ncbi:hypothetical protein Tco_0716545 [Tanacetum coccineum]
MVLNSPCFTVKSWLVQDQTVPVQKQTAFGKDKSNPLIVDSLLKTIRLSIHLVVYNEELAIPEQTATGKGISNPLMAGSLPKTTKPTSSISLTIYDGHLYVALSRATIPDGLKGTPIQANMDIKDADYFHQLFQLKKAYRIIGFSCEQTGAWDRTLENPTSLIFGRHVDLIELPNDGFPEHYFNFASYNELPARADGRNIPLAAYKAVNRVYMSGDATTNCIDRRTIDIQNLRSKNNNMPTVRLTNKKKSFTCRNYICRILNSHGSFFPSLMKEISMVVGTID